MPEGFGQGNAVLCRVWLGVECGMNMGGRGEVEQAAFALLYMAICHVPSIWLSIYMISVFVTPTLTRTPCPWLEDNPSTLYECLVICLDW